MRRFLTLTRKEAAGILLSPPILFATAFFVLLDSFAFYLTTRQGTPLAMFDDVALFMLFTSIVMFPLISMHSFSEDNATGTLETLLTAPIGRFATILAKYSGAMVFVVLHLLHGVVYALLLSYGGHLDWRSTATAFLALFAVGSLAISLGVFVSALTMSPVAAAAGTGGILIFMALAADLDPYAGAVSDIAHSVSFLPHAKRLIAGQLDTRGFVYFISATVLFLFYAWLAINSRELEKRNPNPTVRRRMTVTYALVAAGFVLLLAQAAVLHIGGFWEYGMPLGVNLPRVPWFRLLPLGVAAVAFCWSVLTYRAARRAARGTQPQRAPTRRYATISDTEVMKAPRYYYEENLRARRRLVLAALGALVVVLNLNWLSHYPFRTFAGTEPYGFLSHLQERGWDVSEDARNSLSPTTRRVLDTLQGRVQIYSFIPDDLHVREVPVAEETRRLLGRYTDYDPLISTTFADAGNEPDLAARLARELEISSENLAELLVVDYQGRRSFIPAATLAAAPDWKRQMAGDSRWVFDGENRITQALLRLADPRMPNVYFTYGHQELVLERGLYPERSANRLARAMTGANMRVRQHAIAQTGPVPADCDILVIAAPRTHFLKEEAEEIARYLARGGRLLVFAPAAAPEVSVEGDPLNALLFEMGGGARDDVVEDGKNNDNGQALSPLGQSRSGTDSSPEVVFTLSRTIRDNPRAPENGWSVERMIESYPTAFAAALADGAARPGPFTMMYRAVKDGDLREARVVVMASGRMAADSDITRGDNEGVVMGMVQWLAGRGEATDTPPRQWIDRRLKLTGPQMRAVLWIGVVALPLIWLLAGISVWWVRRD